MDASKLVVVLGGHICPFFYDGKSLKGGWGMFCIVSLGVIHHSISQSRTRGYATCGLLILVEG